MDKKDQRIILQCTHQIFYLQLCRNLLHMQNRKGKNMKSVCDSYLSLAAVRRPTAFCQDAAFLSEQLGDG